ncbi:MAG: hypothetical protein U5P41_15805 [Gammaproteobacteria bacterium]|nr:hypothetical protein [Gammaproteobacteria bacterium]
MAEQELPEIKLDDDNLYQEEAFTDRRVGTLMRLTPVNKDGSRDDGRNIVYVGQASLMTPMGSLPLHFQLEADSLEDALAKYPDEANKALERTLKELEEMRREQAGGGIITPDKMGGAGGLGGQGGGGGIQMP